MGQNVSTTYITCPADPNKTLGIKLPFLVLIIKNLNKYFRQAASQSALPAPPRPAKPPLTFIFASTASRYKFWTTRTCGDASARRTIRYVSSRARRPLRRALENIASNKEMAYNEV